MGSNLSMGELSCIAGAYGPVECVPLLSDLIGPKLLDMVAIGCSKSVFGSSAAIFQNDGTVFPLEGRLSLFKEYCREIRSTHRGYLRCIACDCQAVRLTGGNQAVPGHELEKNMRDFCVKQTYESEFGERSAYCYECHAGLVELAQAIRLDFGDGEPVPIGTIWAGQNKVKGHTLPEGQVRQLAREIGYPDPDSLWQLYNMIELIDLGELLRRAKNLRETTRPMDEYASASFHGRKQADYDRLSNELLNDLRASFSQIRTTSAQAIQRQAYDRLGPVLERMTSHIGNCVSVLCEMPSGTQASGNPKVEVRIVAQAGCGARRLEKINLRQGDCENLLRELERASELKSFDFSSLDCEFLRKIENAVQVVDIRQGIGAKLPALGNTILWVTLLRENSDAITPRGNVLPAFTRMLANLLHGVSQITSVAYLVAQQQDTVRTLEKQKKQLEEKGSQTRLLIDNLAHQVSRPIMELKQAAHILSKGFSTDAYEGFRACLAELERGCRNFDIYEKLHTDFDKRGQDLLMRKSFDLPEIVEESRKRILPYSRVERIEILVDQNTEKGDFIPKADGNPEAVLEALANVLHNAIKYSVGGYPVAVELSRGWSSTVEVRVTNLGIELPREDWEMVFEEATRAETAKAVAIEGSGLGLYVSRKLLALHGGAIRVESCVPGKPLEDGTPRWETTFVVSLRY